MYFPQLLGLAEEAKAVAEARFLNDGLILPVLHPVSLSDTKTGRPWVVRNLHEALRAGRRFALVVNSAKGGSPPTEEEVYKAIEEDFDGSSRVYKALEIRDGVTTDDVVRFAGTNEDSVCLMIHRKHPHGSELPLGDRVVHLLVDDEAPPAAARLPGLGRVLVRDRFQHQSPNAAYPAWSPFDDLLYTFDELGFDGFGDFTIVGDRQPPGGGHGGWPLTRVLHLTEAHGGELKTRHFLSDPPPRQGDTQRKYFQALRRLVDYTEGNPHFDTAGVNAFRRSLLQRRHSNLGVPKRWSILHHMEVIHKELTRRGAVPFV